MNALVLIIAMGVAVVFIMIGLARDWGYKQGLHDGELKGRNEEIGWWIAHDPEAERLMAEMLKKKERV